MVHPAVDERIVHGVAHGQPVDHQVHLLNVLPRVDLRIVERADEVDVLRQPADGEDRHHHNHHFDDLREICGWVCGRRSMMAAGCTHAPLAADAVQLAGGALADALRAPQLDADARVREQHADDRHEVGGRHEQVVVTGVVGGTDGINMFFFNYIFFQFIYKSWFLYS